MSKVFLISDITNSFSLKLAKGLLDRDNIVIGLNSSFENELFNDGLKNRNFHIYNWNSSSPLSSTKIIKKCLNEFGKIDYAFLVFSPVGSSEKLYDLATFTLEKFVDEKIKGTLFLARELSQLFNKSKNGGIGLVCNNTPEIEKNFIDSIFLGMYNVFDKSIREDLDQKSFRIDSFNSGNMIDSEFSSYVLKSFTSGEKGKGSRENSSKKKSSQIFSKGFFGRR